MRLPLSARSGAIAAMAAVSLTAVGASGASAAVPVAGVFSGTTLQPKLNPADPAEHAYAGTIDFKVYKHKKSRSFLHIGASSQLRCASGEVREDAYSVYVVLGGKISRTGRFAYEGKGFSMKGRFTSRTSAKGTFSRTVGDCKVENVSWTAKRGAPAGLPIPTARVR